MMSDNLLFSPFKKIWIPKSKEQLVEWLEKEYPDNKKFAKMRKKQLYAIYFKVRGLLDA